MVGADGEAEGERLSKGSSRQATKEVSRVVVMLTRRSPPFATEEDVEHRPSQAPSP